MTEVERSEVVEIEGSVNTAETTVDELERKFAEQLKGRHRAYYVRFPEEPPYMLQVSTDPTGEVVINVEEGEIVNAYVKTEGAYVMGVTPTRREFDRIQDVGLCKTRLVLEQGNSFLTIEGVGDYRFILLWEYLDDLPPTGQAWYVEINDPTKLKE